MTVGQLIEHLSKFNPESTALCPNGNGDYRVVESVETDDQYADDVLITSKDME